MAEYNPVDLNYKPDIILMTCSDGRFKPAFDATAQARGHLLAETPPNEIRIPGPSISIVDEKSRPVIVGYVEALHGFFESDTVAIYDHYPCGKMKLAVEGYAEADEAGQIEFHKRYLKLAGEIIQQALPNAAYQPHLVGPEREIPLKD